MTITISWAKGETTGSREFRNERVAERFAEGLCRTGYTVTTETPAAEIAETPARTGRCGRNGKVVHELVEGGATKCGSAYRRGLGANLAVYATGEPVTCRHCL